MGSRLEDWPERLDKYLSEVGPFNWETNNCALFAANAVLAMTGRDFAADYRGPRTKRGTYGRLKQVCGGDVTAAATRELGEPLESPLFARRGDIVAFDFGEGNALGVCLGRDCVFIGRDGIVTAPLLIIKSAWRV